MFFDAFQILDLMTNGALIALTGMMGFLYFISQRKCKKGLPDRDSSGKQPEAPPMQIRKGGLAAGGGPGGKASGSVSCDLSGK